MPMHQLGSRLRLTLLPKVPSPPGFRYLRRATCIPGNGPLDHEKVFMRAANEPFQCNAGEATYT